MAMQDEKIKWVEGTPFMVDGFRFTNPRCRHYFLTHFHSDHTTGLGKSFSAGTIYTSEGTAGLVTALIGVNPERVVALPMNKPVMVAGFEVTLVDANHCPAAVMIIFRDPKPGGRITLHTGDFRADKSVCTNPIIKSLKGRLDALYLDTTYCAPQHAFPDQEEVLAQAASMVRMELKKDPNTLFLVGTYSIGKEKVLEAVARAAGSRCLVTGRKARIMRLSGAWDSTVYITHDAGEGGVDGEPHARVRAVPLQVLHTPAALLGALAEAKAAGAPFTSVVGVRPTGWTHHNSAKEGQQMAKDMTKRARDLEMGASATGRGREGGERDTVTTSSVVLEESGLDMLKDQGDSMGFGNSFEDSLWEGCEDDLCDQAAPWQAEKLSEGPGSAVTKGGGRDTAGRRKEGAGGLGQGLGVGGGENAVEAEAWNGGKPRHMAENARVHSLPYSEHSSYLQLREFVRTVRPKKIIPTVNASSGAAVEKLLKHFLEFMDLSQDRKRLDSYFCKPSAATTSSAGFGDGTSGGGTPRRSEARTPAPTPAAKRMRNIAGGAAGARKASTAAATLTGAFKGRNNEQMEEAAVNHIGEAGEGEKEELVASPRPPPLRCLGALPAPASAEADVIDLAAGTARSADNLPRRETRVHGASDGSSPVTAAVPIVVDSVDVEAQKAILADIERRNRLRGLPPPPTPPSPRQGTPKSDKARTIKMESTAVAAVPNPCATTPSVRRTEGQGEGGQPAGFPQEEQLSEATTAVPTAARMGRGTAVTNAHGVENRRPLSSLTGRGQRGGESAAGRGGRNDSKAVGKTARRGSTSTSGGTPDAGRAGGGRYGGRGGGRSLGKGHVTNSNSKSLLDGGAVSAGIEVSKEGDGKGRRDSSSPASIRDFFGRGRGLV